MRLNELVQDIHDNAVNHGWWDDERTCGEIIALCHSELSEALEEYRNKRPLMYVVGDNGEIITDVNKFDNRKTEGIAVELVDCVIRILDFCGKDNIDIDDIMSLRQEKDFTYVLPELIVRCHCALSNAYESQFNKFEYSCCFAECISLVAYWCKEKGINIEDIIKIKHEYNKTRPYKHGDKVI